MAPNPSSIAQEAEVPQPETLELFDPNVAHLERKDSLERRVGTAWNDLNDYYAGLPSSTGLQATGLSVSEFYDKMIQEPYQMNRISRHRELQTYYNQLSEQGFAHEQIITMMHPDYQQETYSLSNRNNVA